MKLRVAKKVTNDNAKKCLRYKKSTLKKAYDKMHKWIHKYSK